MKKINTDLPAQIFYTPHADDETLGMGGAICRAKEEKARTIIVLLTDSAGSERMRWLYEGQIRCPIHGGKHGLKVDMSRARMEEFRRAAAVYQADEVAYARIPEQLLLDDRAAFIGKVAGIMESYEVRYPGAVHHTVAGAQDIHSETGKAHATHVACHTAGVRVAIRQHVRFHRVYVYSWPVGMRRAQIVDPLGEYEVIGKQNGIASYQQWQPKRKKLAYGYHSATDLFLAAFHDPREFVDLSSAVIAEVYRDADVVMYRGRAEEYVPADPVDLVFTNPYGPLPAAVMDKPMLIHQWKHRQAEAERWCGRKLSVVSEWNDGKEVMWAANMQVVPVDLTDLRPEPGGWYPEELPRRLLRAYGRPGITVWDGFMGRGTIGKEARALGMRYVGVEELDQHLALAEEFMGIAIGGRRKKREDEKKTHEPPAVVKPETVPVLTPEGEVLTIQRPEPIETR